MRLFTAVLVASLFVSVSVYASWNPDSDGRCTSSKSCPADSKCVDGYCVSCLFDARSCMRNTESCSHCAEDEGCYLRDQTDSNTGVVFSKLECAEKNPCKDRHACQQKCFSFQCGDQPPLKQCRPYNYQQSPCAKKHCPAEQRCFVRAAWCKNETKSTILREEGVCFTSAQCIHCNSLYQHCEVRSSDKGFVGVCANFRRP